MDEEENYVVLRALDEVQPGMLWDGHRKMSESPTWPIDLSVMRLTTRRARDMARDPNTRGIVRTFPMKLIPPIRDHADLVQDNWGIAAVGADTTPFDGDGTVVAILDTGLLEREHEAFGGVDVMRKNFTSESDYDDNGHGTHCAGTVFGRDVAGQRIGVARGIQRALIGKVVNSERTTDSGVVATAILWAIENGANVVSMSLGIDYPGDVKRKVAEGLQLEPATSLALEDYYATVRLFESLVGMLGVRQAELAPCVIIAAAGNESDRPNYTIGVCPPAVAKGIVSVGAIRPGYDGKFMIDSSSNSGPRVCAPVAGLSASLNGGTTAMSGTSVAAPHAAGVAALWIQKLREDGRFSGTELVDRLTTRATRDRLPSDADSHDFGAGIVQSPQSRR